MGVARVLFLYNAAFPPLAFATLSYVGLADAVFGLNTPSFIHDFSGSLLTRAKLCCKHWSDVQ